MFRLVKTAPDRRISCHTPGIMPSLFSPLNDCLNERIAVVKVCFGEARGNQPGDQFIALNAAKTPADECGWRKSSSRYQHQRLYTLWLAQRQLYGTVPAH